jgi:Asp-tRNA(Asn)/Glu-tRNA(Gln) amidotransferase A subunit family amidase
MSAGCKPFGEVQVASKSTSPAIQSLIDQGATLVGMLKTTPMAIGMSAGDWGYEAGFTCPVNPRGNRHLDPDCSSAGSAASIAAYEWLDVAV